MAEQSVDQTAVFQFMVLRGPEPPSARAARRDLIRDDILAAAGRVDRELFAPGSTSKIGRLVYEVVFCSDNQPGFSEDFGYLLARLLPFLARYGAPCGDEKLGTDLSLTGASDRHTFTVDGTRYLVPDRLSDVPDAPLLSLVLQIRPLMEDFARRMEAGSDPAVAELADAIRALLDGQRLYQPLFAAGGSDSPSFAATKQALFEALYLLYLLRRVMPFDLADLQHGLRILHAWEAMAIDELLSDYAGFHPGPAGDMIAALRGDYPELLHWRPPAPLPPRFPLVRDGTALLEYLAATPVIHPLFALLHGFRKPFNPIRPIGVGDLKVVKQWLCGYEVGEIAHVENVLLGETRNRVHRHLEKTEDVFTSSSEDQTETVRDTQTTDRFELKREAEALVKTDLNVTASLGLNVTYNNPAGYAIVTNVGGGFAYNRSQTDQVKVTSNFAHEVVDKALKRVQSKVSQQRTTTKLFETEEITSHGFNNAGGQSKTHISGLYKWLDKHYKAQVFNYGKRMMFEFLVPEPAAFLVESRMRALEATLELPRVPEIPDLATLQPDVAALKESDIDPEKLDLYNKLNREYDLSDLPPPAVRRTVEFTNPDTGGKQFVESGMTDNSWQARSFRCRLGAKDYRVHSLHLIGHLEFGGTGEPGPAEKNTLQIRVDGDLLYSFEDNTREQWYWGNSAENVPNDVVAAASTPMTADEVTLSIGFWDIKNYYLSIQAQLVLSDAAKLEWQRKVLDRVLTAARKKVDDTNRDRQQTYASEMATYRNRLDEVRAIAVNDLLRSRSEAANRQLVLRELKRQVLAMITREFDADTWDDRITDLDATGIRNVPVEYHRLKVTEKPDSTAPTSVSARFELQTGEGEFPVPRLDVAHRKGRYVQFLEQAFEWPQLSFICYPYFWAVPPRWVDLMNRGDDVDPFFTEFLQAGYARVLLAVTPAYDHAVCHYLHCGEPWEGGDTPVIGDPLFIPLYQELRRQTDDLANAVPEGEPWDFRMPTSLVYLENSSTPLPPSACD